MEASLDSRTASGTDPGAVDNRLSLDPNDPNWKDTIADWKDGGEYELTIKVNQISPGEFEVTEVSAESEDAGETDAADEEDDSGAEDKGMMGKPNKAVRSMMAQGM